MDRHLGGATTAATALFFPILNVQGADPIQQECFHACVSGCSYKFGVPSEKADQVLPNRPVKPAAEKKCSPPPIDPELVADDMPSTSA